MSCILLVAILFPTGGRSLYNPALVVCVHHFTLSYILRSLHSAACRCRYHSESFLSVALPSIQQDGLYSCQKESYLQGPWYSWLPHLGQSMPRLCFPYLYVLLRAVNPGAQLFEVIFPFCLVPSFVSLVQSPQCCRSGILFVCIESKANLFAFYLYPNLVIPGLALLGLIAELCCLQSPSQLVFPWGILMIFWDELWIPVPLPLYL